MQAPRAALRRERHRAALGETFAGSPLTGIELGRRRSREVTRLEQVVGSAYAPTRLCPSSGRARFLGVLRSSSKPATSGCTFVKPVTDPPSVGVGPTHLGTPASRSVVSRLVGDVVDATLAFWL
jgi:hypothetical protein